jgi:ribosomal protein L7/L12
MNDLNKLVDLLGVLSQEDIAGLLACAEGMVGGREKAWDDDKPNAEELLSAGKGRDGFIWAVKSFRNRTGRGLLESKRMFEKLGFGQ